MKTTLTLLHGLGASHEKFAELVASIERGVSVVLIGSPGYGDNIITAKDQISFDNFCDLIMGLCDH